MEKMEILEQNLKFVQEKFPICITEVVDSNGRVTRKIDFAKLKMCLGEIVSEEDSERYDFTWAGKRDAYAESTRRITKTLRPVVSDSLSWDKTGNLYIEGDNLDVLKLLQESYMNTVKMIYIDPPYNTGSDFIYSDNFAQSAEEYYEEIGLHDEEGRMMFKNTDANGRFHSDWCSMIYSRLLLARNLLSDEGAIFISIDDNEVENLKKICNEVFGGRRSWRL